MKATDTTTIGLRGAIHALLPGRRRSGLAARKAELGIVARSGLLDRDYYLEVYPDVASSGMDPVEHYLQHGAAEGRNPCKFFDTQFYLESNPDVVASGLNPLRHFCEFGWREGRNPSAAFDLRRYAAEMSLPDDVNPLLHRIQNPAPGERMRSDAEIFGESGLFDEAFYRSRNPDIASSGANPFDHFVRHGSKEGRDPCAQFDSSYYLKCNPDVRRAGMPPFRHFCLHGWRELRNPSASFDTAHYWLAHMLPIGAQGNPLAHFGSVGQASGLHPAAVGATKPLEKAALADRAEEALEGGEHGPDALEMLAQALARFSRWPAAESAFRMALAERWGSAKLHSRLAEVLEKQGKWWQVVESLIVATNLDGRHPGRFFRLGEAQTAMNRPEAAVAAYRRALRLRSDISGWHYQLGLALDQLGQRLQAQEAYARAVELDRRDEVRQMGLGALHQANGRWQEAAAAYGEAVAVRPLDAQMWFHLGMAHDRCYRWTAAQTAYQEAISLSPGTADWHYRLGFVLERQQRLEDAAAAYRAAVILVDEFTPCWSYRHGYVLQQAGHLQEACKAYMAGTKRQTFDGHQLVACSGDQGRIPVRSEIRVDNPDHERYMLSCARPERYEQLLKSDQTEADLHYAAACQYEMAGDWEAAALAYGNAIARKDDHMPEWYYRLGYVLFRAGNYTEACAAFENTSVLRRAFGVPVGRQAEAKASEQEYLEYCETLPLAQKTIFYESYHGASISCNPAAIFEHLVDKPAYADWKHVWAVNDKQQIPPEWKARPNVYFVRRGSDLYRRYLASASHLINNNTFMPWFVRRPGQKYLNTWHGTPLKGLGRDIRGDFMAHRNAARNLLHASHVISPNRHTSDVLILRNDVRGAFAGKIAETGYPRIDRTLNSTSADKRELKRRLGLAEDRPIVLYAPTWRGRLGAVEVDTSRVLDDVAKLASLPCQLVFRGHHMAEQAIAQIDLPATVIPHEVDTNELLSIVDVLITDYSSIFFDFLPTRRPVLFYPYDLGSYTEERGLYFDLSEMPGPVCRDVEALLRAAAQSIERLDHRNAKYQAALQRFSAFEDGNATDRVVKFFFEDDASCEIDRYVDGRQSLLLYVGGFIPNGITTSCLNLLHNLDQARYRVTVAIDPASVARERARKEKLAQLPTSVGVLARVGEMNVTPEEAWVLGQFKRLEGEAGPEMLRIYTDVHRREFSRMFGDAHFDNLVQFDGYIPFWTSLFAFASSGLQKAIYLHNDMRGELQSRFPFLRRIFSLYKYYDRLVSVSLSVHEANVAHLSEGYGLAKQQFFHCDNVLDISTARTKSAEKLDPRIDEWIGSSTLLATLGRLSPEKGHKKLIRAFREVSERLDRDIKLVIAGDGPLRPELEALIDELGLGQSVKLVGQLSNPFSLLERTDLFVFSSDYEGQGLAVLEALLMGKPVVATDVVGPRTVLEGGYGSLVENSEGGLVTGIVDYFSSGREFRRFDGEAYQRNALDAFYRMIEPVRQPRLILAARNDGLGERLNALLNGIFIAEKLGCRFGYHWPSTGSWEKVGASGADHAVVPNEQFFSSEFIERHSIDLPDRRGFLEIKGKQVTRDHLLSNRDPGFKGWLAPRIDLKEVLAGELWPVELGLGKVFRAVGFAPRIAEAIKSADTVGLPANSVALHLRSGDIFYGPYRKLVNYTYKGLTLPIAKAIIERVKSDGGAVLLFGQDRDSMEYLRREAGALLLDDVAAPVFSDQDAQAMFEIVLMSRCSYIVAGSSGFAKLASWIGGVPVRQPKDFFSAAEQTHTSLQDLDGNADAYHPLQSAFAYWYAYFCGRHAKPFELADKLLAKAYHYDPENQLYPIKRAANCFRAGRFEEGEAHLRRLILAEYIAERSPRLPLFKVLTGRTVGVFNLAEDFPSIEMGAARGLLCTAVCNWVIKREQVGDAALDDATRTLESIAEADPELTALRSSLISK